MHVIHDIETRMISGFSLIYNIYMYLPSSMINKEDNIFDIAYI